MADYYSKVLFRGITRGLAVVYYCSPIAGFFLPHPDRLSPDLVCLGRPFFARRASDSAFDVPRRPPALLLPLLDVAQHLEPAHQGKKRFSHH